MSTQTINISPKNVAGKCDLKCNFNFKYYTSNSTATNNGILLSFSYDKTNIPPVIYNDAKYNVNQMMIYSQSLHLFEGTRTSAEVVIEHIPVLGGKNLYVCIPIIQSSDTSSASNMLSPMIMMASSKAPSDGTSVNLNINNFTLDTIVPFKPFYSYTGDFFRSQADFIVYGINNAIPMSQNICDTLKKIIKSTTRNMVGGSLFYNDKGPNGNIKQQGIYISCQPVNKSGKVIAATAIKNDTTRNDFNFGNLGSNKSLQLLIYIFIGFLFFGMLFFLLNYGYNFITKGKLPELPKFDFGFRKKT